MAITFSFKMKGNDGSQICYLYGDANSNNLLLGAYMNAPVSLLLTAMYMQTVEG